MTSTGEERARSAALPVVDFDIELDPQFRIDPSVKWREALDIGPIFYSSAARGFWVVTQYDLVREIVHKPEEFSSREIYLFYREPLDFFDVPTQLDPPAHLPIRRLVQPFMSPGSIRALEPSIRSICSQLVNEIVGKSVCEFNRDFALRLPALVIMRQLGLPDERERELVELVLRTAHPDSTRDPGLEGQRAAAEAIDEMWRGVIAERRRRPQDDWTSHLVASEIDGEKLDDALLVRLMGTLLRGGFDTTAGTLGYAFHHLATHREERHRLISNPSEVDLVVEEFLRWYGGVPLITRTAARDLVFHGAPMEAGDRIVLLLRAANHDPKAFADPDMFAAHRTPNKHLAFGLGQHRCAGMHLARAELRIALEEWHARIPDYQLLEPVELEHEVSQNIRLASLPLALDDGADHVDHGTPEAVGSRPA